MSKNKPPRITSNKIRSLHDLEMAKTKLKLELYKSEIGMKSSYQNLVHSLSIGNLFESVIEKIASASGFVISTIASIISAFRKEPEPEGDGALSDLESE